MNQVLGPFFFLRGDFLKGSLSFPLKALHPQGHAETLGAWALQWVIPKFSALNAELYSDTFEAGGLGW